jgi:hypothetical protein
MRPVNRIQPVMPVGAYKTYQIIAPVSTHFRPATCEEVDCGAWKNGWATTVLPGSDDETVVRGAGRRFIEERTPDGFVRFIFPAGQSCFAVSRHRVPLERPPIHIVRHGDWRGNPSGQRRQHTRPEHWVEDFAEHQDQIKTTIERG